LFVAFSLLFPKEAAEYPFSSLTLHVPLNVGMIFSLFSGFNDSVTQSFLSFLSNAPLRFPGAPFFHFSFGESIKYFFFFSPPLFLLLGCYSLPSLVFRTAAESVNLSFFPIPPDAFPLKPISFLFMFLPSGRRV